MLAQLREVVSSESTARDFGIGMALLAAVLAFVNGLYMLISPKSWFNLPDWLGGKGTLTREKYTRGLGALQVRVLGAAILGSIAWVVYDAFVR